MRKRAIAIGSGSIVSVARYGGSRIIYFPDAAAGGGGITITVASNIATTTVSATDYTWPVATGGAGAAAGTLDLSGSVALFTYSGTNYQFPVSLSGSGGSSITVSANIASLAIDATNCQWPVDPV